MSKDLNDLIFPGSYELRNSSGINSIQVCTAICANEPQCMSFSYNNNSHVCKLMNRGFIYASDGSAELNWKTFILGDAGCPLEKGFLQNRQYNLCLHVSDTNMNRPLAEGYCANLTSRLVILDNVQKVTGFGLMMNQQKIKPKLHIGLKKISGVWEWGNGRVLGTEKNWQPGQPYCPGLSGCMCAFPFGSSDFRWYDDDCNDQARPVCEPL
jgi:hypothetical protein